MKSHGVGAADRGRDHAPPPGGALELHVDLLRIAVASWTQHRAPHRPAGRSLVCSQCVFAVVRRSDPEVNRFCVMVLLGEAVDHLALLAALPP